MGMSSDPYTRWSQTPDDELTVDGVREIFHNIPDDLWLAAASIDRCVHDIQVQRVLLQLALERTQLALERVKNLAEEDALVEYFKELPADAQLCHIRSLLLDRLDRLNTYVEVCGEVPEFEEGEEEEKETETDEEWEDDPWAETDTPITKTASPPITLVDFLSNDLMHSAFLLAVHQWFGGLRVLLQRHHAYLWPYRFALLSRIPPHVNPTKYHTLLPSCDIHTNLEQPFQPNDWRIDPDVTESSLARSAILKSDALSAFDSPTNSSPPDIEADTDALSAEQLSLWYHKRAEDIIDITGMVDIAFALIQHGASNNVPNLDELGEELSLLARLVYDAPHGDVRSDEDWTLARWRAMDPPSVVRAYLAHSTPASVSRDIIQLVLPYLFVLESHAERSGKPDPKLPDRLLHDFILHAPLNLVLSIFEASKPTLPAAQRIIKHDADMVQLALAGLYGSDSLHEWTTMSGIFECLPVWEIAADDDEEEAADTTIISLGTYVTPSTTGSKATPSNLLVFFKPLPLSSLSRALDILDVHLESGEIFSRWNVPAPLRWFLRSSSDVAEQRAWANRMARKAGGYGDQLSTQEDWEWLLEDMLKLAGETKIKGAFGLLSRDEIIRIFLSGLMSTGKFDVTKSLLRNSIQLNLDSDTLEDICLACSREFYDNSSSGNYKFGEMKLAYDCLDVPPSSDRLLKEKEFIEATSRLSSFNIMSRPGIPISPIEIRLTKDRLTLVSRVLSSNMDAYKHAEVILDLVYKLGFRDDIVAEVKTLAMLADTALQAEDFTRAFEANQRMIDTVLNLRATLMGLDNPKVREASEVCWVACFQLGRQTEFEDSDKKLVLLGRAIEICPPDRLHDVLTAWRRLEKDSLTARRGRITKDHDGAVKHTKASKSPPETAASSLQARLKEFHMPSPPLLSTPDARALASKTFNTVAANFSFSVGHRGRSQFSSQLSQGGDERSRSGSRRQSDADDVQTQASRVFSKGIGWLIGADEEI
ncbi:hypothetical protein D9757_005391 [Collybiopsis confluens]|uniref:Sec39 domain-containing protein n=1 Tax=Collybiopsis confluens TaxID=2823264 RepID=A0A8H5M9H9_9AGAR|nr:hypothetical protein D9757_005391 [Collybiopsis confluens]